MIMYVMLDAWKIHENCTPEWPKTHPRCPSVLGKQHDAHQEGVREYPLTDLYVILVTLGRYWVPNRAPSGSQIPCKIKPNIDEKIIAEKVSKNREQTMENSFKIEPGIDEKSMRFGNPQFLGFC